MVRLLLDEGLPLRAAALLRAHGLDVTHVRDIGLAAAADPAILDAARDQNRACVTLDRDFHMLLAESGAMRPSVIFIRERQLNYTDAAEHRPAGSSIRARTGARVRHHCDLAKRTTEKAAA